MGSLGWDISGSYHVLQLLSSLTSKCTAIPEAERSRLLNILYQEIIMRTILSSKERFTITTQRSQRAFAEQDGQRRYNRYIPKAGPPGTGIMDESAWHWGIVSSPVTMAWWTWTVTGWLACPLAPPLPAQPRATCPALHGTRRPARAGAGPGLSLRIYPKHIQTISKWYPYIS